MRAARKTTAVLAGLATMAGLAGCTNEATPTYLVGDDDGEVVIQVSAADPENRVLAEIYRRALASGDVHGVVETVDPDSERGKAGQLEWLADGGADLVIGCTGQLLADAQPEAAETLDEEFNAEEDSDNPTAGDAGQRTYDALLGALPGDYDVPDPSPAEGCSQGAVPDAKVDKDASGKGATSESAGEALPQNIVPVYRKTSVNRWGKKGLNDLTRLLTTHDLQEMTEQVEDGGDPDHVVGEWLGESNSDLLE